MFGLRKLPQAVAQLSTTARAGLDNPQGPVICEFDFVEPMDGAQRQAPHTFDQSESEHRRHRPQLADGKRCHTLKRFHK